MFVWNVLCFFCLYRVIFVDGKKSEICGWMFISFGVYCDDYGSLYFIVVVVIGMMLWDIDLFIIRLDKVLIKSVKIKDLN